LTTSLFFTINLVELDELISERVLSLLINISGISDRALNLFDLRVDVLQFWKVVSLSRERVTDLLNSVSDVVTIPEDNDVD